jgi:hypothetical protein
MILGMEAEVAGDMAVESMAANIMNIISIIAITVYCD